MPGNPYNMTNPNQNFFQSFYVSEGFDNKGDSLVTNQVDVTVTNNEFLVGNNRLTRTCPHNGCRLNYSEDRQQFVCPCHSSTLT